MPFDGTQLTPHLDAVAKLDKVIAFIDTPDKWCKQQLRNSRGQRCMLGAIAAAGAAANETVTNAIKLAIKDVVGPTRSYVKIEMFNDSPLTTHADVMRALMRARELLMAGRPVAKIARQIDRPQRRGVIAMLRSLVHA